VNASENWCLSYVGKEKIQIINAEFKTLGIFLTRPSIYIGQEKLMTILPGIMPTSNKAAIVQYKVQKRE